MAELWTNNASSLLASGIAAGDLLLNVTTGEGALFPAIGSNKDHFHVTVEDSGGFEIMLVTARSTDQCTIVRAQESTSARTFSAGATVKLLVTAAALGRFEAKGADITSAATLVLPKNATFAHVTGNTGTTAIEQHQAGMQFTFVFDGTPTWTHHATNLILPGGANITWASGDVVTVRAEAAGWRVVSVALAAGASDAAQSANMIKAGPTSGAAALPTYRALVDADFPTTLKPRFAALGLGMAAPAAGLAVADAVTCSSSLTNDTGTGHYLLADAQADAANPTYSFNGDTNTGMFRVSADVLGFSTGGTERVRIDNSGRLLVGTTETGGAAAGDLVLKNGGAVRAAKAAGGAALSLFQLGSDNNLYFGDGPSGVTISVYFDSAQLGLAAGSNKQMTAGAIDSAGSGYRVLRVPN